MNLSNSRRNLAYSKHYEQTMVGGNMRATRAQTSEWNRCKFEGVQFDASDLTGCRIINTVFVGCSFQNSVFTGAGISGTFDDCDLISCNFTGADLKDASFINCRMEYSSFLDANLQNVKFRNCNLSGAYLLYMYAKGVDYCGSNLHNTSIKLGCPFFRDSTFDRRQWSYMQALISQVSGVSELQDHVAPFIDPAINRVVERMMDDDHDPADEGFIGC